MQEANLIGNWVALTESARQPMLSFGTSSDRIFSEPGKRAYYATAAKSLTPRISPYVSLSYSEWEKRFLVPFGVNISLGKELDLLGMNDGRNTHLLLTWKGRDVSTSFMLVKMTRPGISVSFGL